MGCGLRNPCIPDEYRSFKRSFVEIGDYVVTFTNAIIYPGVKMGEGAVVMAGAIGKNDLAPWGFYNGNPPLACVLRKSERTLRVTGRMIHKYGY
jgi:acetyltransferase-like isoleucine patch superfamily enzyme